MRRFFDWLRRRHTVTTPSTNTPQIRWLEPNENPFGVRMLDCRSYALGRVSTTGSPQVAMTYGKLRGSFGEEYRGKLPNEPRSVVCSFNVPLDRPAEHGPLFKSREMEEKWDIYFYDGYLYFTRSWTGELIHRAAAQAHERNVQVTCIESHLNEETDEYIAQEVDFLIKSHVVGFASVHPLPPSRSAASPEELAAFSYAKYGRRGLYGTFANTLTVKMSPSG